VTGEDEGRCLRIPVSMTGALATWLVAFALLAWETAGGVSPVASEWALVLSAVAAAWTVIIAQGQCRRKMVKAINRELILLRDSRDSDEARMGLVRN
jgi:hypothetical protein